MYDDGETLPTQSEEDGDLGPEHEVLIRCTEGETTKFAARVSLASRILLKALGIAMITQRPR